MKRDRLEQLGRDIADFNDSRDWWKFHSPKNISMALTKEAAELMEHFQWVTEDQSREMPPEAIAKIREEVGDVMIYLMILADTQGIEDVIQAAFDKLAINKKKYPVSLAKGNCKKYTELV